MHWLQNCFDVLWKRISDKILDYLPVSVPITASLERRNMEAEETNIAAAKQARSQPLTTGILLNFSKTSTRSIIITACPIFDFACITDCIPTRDVIV